MSVYITNVGFTKVGDHWSKSLSELAFESCKDVLLNESSPPDAIVVSNAVGEITSSQGNMGALVADSLQLDRVPAYKVEASGASGAEAINLATNLIRSGQSKKTLVIGVEKMRDLDPSKVMLAQSLSENADFAQFFGITFTAMNALLARLYMNEYAVTREKLSAFPAIAHANSSLAKHAQFKKKFTVEEVSRSEMVSDPLRVLDCPPVGDGAACAIVASGDSLSSSKKKDAVKILSSESSSNRMNFFEREKMLNFEATQSATKKALAKSGIGLNEISLFEIHDAYSDLAALSAEAIGLSKPGKSCDDATSGKFDLSGDFPISTFGGMKGRGYPVGAVGVYQICEAFLQLTGKAGANQVKGASRALVQSMAGIDSLAFVHILESGAAN
jgi:acetyl-CoA C-acetyltransferase